jgi:hypothetical protein
VKAPHPAGGWCAARLAMVTLTATATITATSSASAQEFGLTLRCKGSVTAKSGAREAHIDMALRRNNGTALVQRSDILPVGERLKFETSPAFYSMVFKAPSRGTTIYQHWWTGALFIWSPDLLKLHTVRLSIDRQTAALEGEMRDGADATLGRFNMVCTPQTNEEAPEPKF